MQSHGPFLRLPSLPWLVAFSVRRPSGTMGMIWVPCSYRVSRNCRSGGFCISLSLYFQGSPGPAGPRGSIGRPGFWGRKVNIISHWFQMRGTEGSYISSLTVWKFFTWWLNPSTMLNHLHAASGFSPISGCRLPYRSPVSRKLPLLQGESYLPFTKHCWESLQFPYSLSSNAFVGWDEWIDLNLFSRPLSVSPRLTMAKVAVVEMDKSQQLASCAPHSSAFVLQALGSVWLQRSPLVKASKYFHIWAQDLRFLFLWSHFSIGQLFKLSC